MVMDDVRGGDDVSGVGGVSGGDGIIGGYDDMSVVVMVSLEVIGYVSDGDG
jgi:hypothetical protein